MTPGARRLKAKLRHPSPFILSPCEGGEGRVRSRFEFDTWTTRAVVSQIFGRSEAGLALQRGRPPDLNSARCGQLEQSVQVRGGFNAHDELLQLFALIFADNVASERGEFYRDFVFGHGIARIAFWNIDTGGVRLAVVSGDGHAARLEFWKERLELVVGHH